MIDPGDEVVLFEPFYENYGPDTQLCGAVPHYVTLRAPDWSFDPDELRALVVGVKSGFYPQMGKLYKRRIEAATR